MASLRFCNETDASASVAVGYEADDGEWTSEGWWQIAPGDCKTTIGGDLKRRSYYWRATSKDYSWSHERYMFCTSPKAFTIKGDEDCVARGYDRNPFNIIELAEGVRDFKFTLRPPAKAASPKISEAAPPAGDPPGTHGEPYTIAGLLSGCEGTDTAIVCDLYNEGFRYRASSGRQTPTETIEMLMDLPVNTPMVWSGDMISIYDALVDVTIREARREGKDPFANVRAHLQGYWTSKDDPSYQLLISGALFEEYSDTIPTDTRIVEVARTCEGSAGDGPYLIAHPYHPSEETRCFEIVEAAGNQLVLFPLGTMNFLEFTKPN